MTVEMSAHSDVIETIEELEAIYGQPAQAALVKETDRIIPAYSAIIEASPFVALATTGPEGAYCSPRGDQPGFVRIHNKHTLMMPDRRGNNRIDSLKNIVLDGRVGLLFLVPGSGTTLRVNGRAKISVDAELCSSFAVAGKVPRSVIVVTVESIYFQCARAIHRAQLWNPEARVDPADMPTPGTILDELSRGEIDGGKYDTEWPERAAKTMW